MACITQINENTFRIRFSEGFYEDGRRNSKSFTVKCSSRRQAELERDKISAQLQSGSTYSPSKMTLNELSKRWLETYVEKNLAKLFGDYMKTPSEDTIKKQMASVYSASWIDLDNSKIEIN